MTEIKKWLGRIGAVLWLEELGCVKTKCEHSEWWIIWYWSEEKEQMQKSGKNNVWHKTSTKGWDYMVVKPALLNRTGNEHVIGTSKVAKFIDKSKDWLSYSKRWIEVVAFEKRG